MPVFDSGFFRRAPLCGLRLRAIGSLLFLAAAAAAAALPARGADGDTPPDTDALAALLAPLANLTTAGASVGVYYAGRLVHSSTYGFADVENRVPMTPATRTNLGSVSKQFTAWLILQAAAAGNLSLDDPVRDHIPELPAYDGADIRLHHLVYHTSGVRDLPSVLSFSTREYVGETPRARSVAMIARQSRLRFAPGARWEYSNSNYILLAEVLERLAGGVPLEEQLRAQIFEPLGMTSTELRGDPRRLYPRLAKSYISLSGEGDALGDLAGLRSAPHEWTAPGSTGILSTAADLAAWDANWSNNTLGGGADLVARAQAPFGMPPRPPADTVPGGSGNQYGAGLIPRTLANESLYLHGGMDAGYATLLLRVPSLRLGLFLATTSRAVFPNLDAAMIAALGALRADVFGALAAKVAADLAPTPTPTPPPVEAVNDPARLCALPPEAVSADAAARLVGVWVATGAGGQGAGGSPTFSLRLPRRAPAAATSNSGDGGGATGGAPSAPPPTLVADLGQATRVGLAAITPTVWVGSVAGVACGLVARFDEAADPPRVVLVLAPAAAAAAGGVGLAGANGTVGATLAATRPAAVQLSTDDLGRYTGSFYARDVGDTFVLRASAGGGLTVWNEWEDAPQMSLLPVVEGGGDGDGDGGGSRGFGGVFATANAWFLPWYGPERITLRFRGGASVAVGAVSAPNNVRLDGMAMELRRLETCAA